MTDENDDASGAEIIELANHQGVEPKLRVIRKTGCFCTLVFDEHERTVTCKLCNRVWEPFEALVYLARTWVQYAANRDSLKREIDQLRDDRARLRQDVANLKAQRKRAALITPSGKR